jgi:hypothetical protein
MYQNVSLLDYGIVASFLEYGLMLDEHFFPERAVILSKMGQHKAALEIYVFRLKDYAKAERFYASSSLVLTIVIASGFILKRTRPRRNLIRNPLYMSSIPY